MRPIVMFSSWAALGLGGGAEDRHLAARARLALKESDRPPIRDLQPATKAESGHDENITMGRMREILGAQVTAELERLTRLVYTRAATSP